MAGHDKALSKDTKSCIKNNTHRNNLKLHMRYKRASQMFADNKLLNFEVLRPKMSNTFINRLTSSDNAIIKVQEK